MSAEIGFEYARGKILGKGAFGSVYKAQHLPTGRVVALKVIDLDQEDDVLPIVTEVSLLSQLTNCPNITQYFGSYLKPGSSEICIAMEYAQGGSVYDLMQDMPSRHIEEKWAAIITREVLTALAFLHQVPVIHRDLKSANILIAETGKVMICDFGISALLRSSVSKRNTWVGSPYWMAPEMVAGSQYDVKVDIWGIGVTVYEMITGRPPHAHLSFSDVLLQIPRGAPPRLSDQESSPQLREFMASCLRERPTERLTPDALLKLKWISNVSKVSVSALKILFPSRNSIFQVLEESEDDEMPQALDSGMDRWSFISMSMADSPDPATPATVRAAAPTSLVPRSLRGIFSQADDDGPPAEPFPTTDAPVFHFFPEADGPQEDELPSWANSSLIVLPPPSEDVTARPIILRKASSAVDTATVMSPTPPPSEPETIRKVGKAAAFNKSTPINSGRNTPGSTSLPERTVSRKVSPTKAIRPKVPEQHANHDPISPIQVIPARLTQPSTSQGFPRYADSVSPTFQFKPRSEATTIADSYDFSGSMPFGLNDMLKLPSLTDDHSIGISDLLPPSPGFAFTRPRTPSATASPSSFNTDIPSAKQPIPFDYAKLMQSDVLQDELQRRIADLQAQLGIVHAGLEDLLA